jgi:thioredoxin reductase/bacterioferritin-associated ferredoxin
MNNKTYECVIVGLGPAGMAASVELTRYGVRVAVVDSSIAPGGQVYRPLAQGSAFQGFQKNDPRQRVGCRLKAEFAGLSPRIDVMTDTQAWGLGEALELYCLSREKNFHLGFERLIICEGAREQIAAFPGWTLPGVMTCGGIQKMIIHQGLLPGRNILLAGSGPLQVAVAANIWKGGGRVAALAEASKMKRSPFLALQIGRNSLILKETLKYLRTILVNRTPIYMSYAPIKAEGQKRVELVTLARIDRFGRPVAGTEKQVPADILGLGYGLQPVGRLTRLAGCEHKFHPLRKYWQPVVDETLATSRPEIRVAGDGANFGGADLAEIDGRLAGIHTACELGKVSESEKSKRLQILDKRKKAVSSYINSLNQVFSGYPADLTLLDQQTIICRCEGVRVRDICQVVDQGCRDINELKRRTCLGMGLCQAGTCETLAAGLMLKCGLSQEQIGRLRIQSPTDPLPLKSFRNKP